MEKNLSIIKDHEGKKLVIINDIRFKGKKREEWDEIEKYLKEYIGNCYEILETSEKIYIGSDFRMNLHMVKIKQYLKAQILRQKQMHH